MLIVKKPFLSPVPKAWLQSAGGIQQTAACSSQCQADLLEDPEILAKENPKPLTLNPKP